MSKEAFYDWYGGNVWLFQHINGLGGDWYNSLMILLSRTGNHRNFFFIVPILIFIALAEYAWRKLGKHGNALNCLTMWFGVFCVLIASYYVSGYTVKSMKNYFEYPRPYVAIGPESVTVLESSMDNGDGYHSFPSSHATYITVLILSLWPIMVGNGRWLGLLLIFGVCWSRVAEGMHFPADVAGGFLIGLVVVTLVKTAVYSILLKLHLKC
jgi:membrane-associated phospholipid phosphatase